MSFPSNNVVPPQKYSISKNDIYDWTGLLLQAICVLKLGIKAKDLGYLRAHHNGFSFYSYTVLTLLNTSVFVLVTAASSITIAALSALSNLFSFIWGAWNSSGFSLLCRDHWYSGPMQYFKNDRIKPK